ncbi:MAG TPA: hypothetical protein VMS32_00465, partial [Verrucomicrobiae bacterium]|nr:hypothetical protein [Verrucomicrobiae bacterium]
EASMLDTFFLESDPFVFLIVLLPLTLVALALGYGLTIRYGKPQDGHAETAFGLGQRAIFGLIALILAFSFSFAAQRFQARHDLVVNEAEAISTTYLRADFLPAAQRSRFRRSLIAYDKTRLETYADVSNALAEGRATDRGTALQTQLWAIASGAARGDPRNPFYNALTSSMNETIDVSEQQAAALDNHIPSAIIGLVLFSIIAGAALLGVTLGRAKSPDVILAIFFCLLFNATVFTIVDLDHPQGGFIHVDVAPLQATLDEMKP